MQNHPILKMPGQVEMSKNNRIFYSYQAIMSRGSVNRVKKIDLH
jgi:hypothetical protein